MAQDEDTLPGCKAFEPFDAGPWSPRRRGPWSMPSSSAIPRLARRLPQGVAITMNRTRFVSNISSIMESGGTTDSRPTWPLRRHTGFL